MLPWWKWKGEIKKNWECFVKIKHKFHSVTPAEKLRSIFNLCVVCMLCFSGTKHAQKLCDLYSTRMLWWKFSDWVVYVSFLLWLQMKQNLPRRHVFSIQKHQITKATGLLQMMANHAWSGQITANKFISTKHSLSVCQVCYSTLYFSV